MKSSDYLSRNWIVNKLSKQDTHLLGRLPSLTHSYLSWLYKLLGQHSAYIFISFLCCLLHRCLHLGFFSLNTAYLPLNAVALLTDAASPFIHLKQCIKINYCLVECCRLMNWKIFTHYFSSSFLRFHLKTVHRNCISTFNALTSRIVIRADRDRVVLLIIYELICDSVSPPSLLLKFSFVYFPTWSLGFFVVFENKPILYQELKGNKN